MIWLAIAVVVGAILISRAIRESERVIVAAVKAEGGQVTDAMSVHCDHMLNVGSANVPIWHTLASTLSVSSSGPVVTYSSSTPAVIVDMAKVSSRMTEAER